MTRRWNARNLFLGLCLVAATVSYSSFSFSNCQSREFDRITYPIEIEKYRPAIVGPLASSQGETVVYVDEGVADQTRAWDVVNRVLMSVKPDVAANSNGMRMIQTSYSVIPRKLNGRVVRVTVAKKVRVNIGPTQYFVDMKLVSNSRGAENSAVEIEVTTIGSLPVKTRKGILNINKDDGGEIVDFALSQPTTLDSAQKLYIRLATSNQNIDSYLIQLRDLDQASQAEIQSSAGIGPGKFIELATSEYAKAFIDLPQFDPKLIP